MSAMQILLAVVGTWWIICMITSRAGSAASKQATENSKTDSYSQRFYLTRNTAYYTKAKEDCLSLGMKLATLPNIEELEDLESFFGDQSVESVWIGARIKNKADCFRNSKFKNECWEWTGFDGYVDYDNETAIPWSPEVYDRPVSPISRPCFDIKGRNLKLDGNTCRNRALCEKWGLGQIIVTTTPSSEPACGCHFFASENSAYYADAAKDCEGWDSHLATILSQSDAKILKAFFSNKTISKAWIGAKITNTPECKNVQAFKKSCWAWTAGKIALPVDDTIIEWDESTEEKIQQSTSRAYYQVSTGRLNFEDNTIPNRYVCQEHRCQC